MSKEFFKRNIQALRKAKGWSQEKLAEEAEVSYHTVFRAEAGVIPRGENISKIAKALNISEAQLFTDGAIVPEKPAFHTERTVGDMTPAELAETLGIKNQSPVKATGPRKELIDLILRIPDSVFLNDEIIGEIRTTIEAALDDEKGRTSS